MCVNVIRLIIHFSRVEKTVSGFNSSFILFFVCLLPKTSDDWKKVIDRLRATNELLVTRTPTTIWSRFNRREIIIFIIIVVITIIGASMIGIFFISCVVTMSDVRNGASPSPFPPPFRRFRAIHFPLFPFPL